MLLVSDDETFKTSDNVDDQLGNRVDIPTVIIKKSDGQSIKRYLNDKPGAKVVMAIKFMSVSNGGPVTVELFMRSDDVKALHFFKEFEAYYGKLSIYPY